MTFDDVVAKRRAYMLGVEDYSEGLPEQSDRFDSVELQTEYHVGYQHGEIAALEWKEE